MKENIVVIFGIPMTENEFAGWFFGILAVIAVVFISGLDD